jgi:type 1 fimbria pilin
MRSFFHAISAKHKSISMGLVCIAAGLLQGNAYAQDITLNFSGLINTPTCIARVTAGTEKVVAGFTGTITMPALSNPTVRLASQGDALSDRQALVVDLVSSTSTSTACAAAGSAKYQIAFTTAATNVNTTTLSGRAILGSSSSQVGIELSYLSGSTYTGITSIPSAMTGLIDSRDLSSMQHGLAAASQVGGTLKFYATPVKLAANNTDITDAKYTGTVTLGINYL